MDTTSTRISAAEQLHELLATDQEIVDFLDDLAAVAAQEMSIEFPVLCGVILGREKRGSVAGSSSEEAKKLDEIQAGFDNGPCLEAQRTHSVMRVGDIDYETRWPEYMTVVREQGLRSVLAVPLELDSTAKAAMNFYSTVTDAFNDREIELAQRFADLVSKAMRVALRIAKHSEAAEDRRKAMESRTAIDVAVGIIMAQNRCSQEEAFELLTRVSSNRNIKLRKLAEDLIASIGQDAPTTAFDE